MVFWVLEYWLRKFRLEYERIQEAINDKGMHVIATSEDMDTLEAYRIYHSRDSSETQYMFMKSEIGLDKQEQKNYRTN